MQRKSSLVAGEDACRRILATEATDAPELESNERS
jgi:hypothetical protein